MTQQEMAMEIQKVLNTLEDLDIKPSHRNVSILFICRRKLEEIIESLNQQSREEPVVENVTIEEVR